MPTIFVTGSSSGIGLETCRLFASQGWQVIATMRNLSRAGDLAAMKNVNLMELDVTDSAQIEKVCREALAQFDVDVLFNNAGYGLMAPFERLPESEIRKLFETDVLGTMLVTQKFIPHFKARRQGQILTTTSLAAIIGLPRDGAYGAAKRAQQGMMESLYYELNGYNIKVKCMIPGGTKTNFQTPINDLKDYEEMAALQRRYLLDGNAEFPEPAEAAQAVWNAVHDEGDRVNYPTDSVCARLYADYISRSYEDFKRSFYAYLSGKSSSPF